ncbi:helix-turn-helix domain-containing protein [Enterococcus villorum]|uniref:helix-turn-helix domain-containing protein n=1 Tax=Enterococcus villorum TaxID=112904 RepID=UPI003F8964B0
MTIGERMKLRRKELKISADEIADALDVSRSTIFRYEKGEIEKLPTEYLSKIAKVLRTTPEKLMGWSKDELEISYPSSKLIPLDKKLGIRVKKYREEKGVSQEILAKALDISVNELNTYEVGGKPFSVNMVFNFAMALNISFDDLFPEDIEYDKIPAIIEVNNEHNCIMTADGKKYTLSDKEMAKVRNLLIFKNRK